MTRDPARTQTLAQIALDQIKTRGLPADPESYALWYMYAAGSNLELNSKIDEVIGSRRLSISEFDRLYDRYVSPIRVMDHADQIGSVLLEQMAHITDLVEASAGSSASLEMQLATATQELKRSVDRETIRAVVETLIRSIKSAEARANSFREELQRSNGVIKQLKEDLKRVREESNTDSLTSLANRRHFDRVLDRAIKAASDTKWPLSLLLIDVDHFKQFNDAHGHQMGDEVLRLVGTVLKSGNHSGLAARLGGEEFGIILPRTNLSEAYAFGESLRNSIMQREVVRRATKERMGRITVSIGVAEYAPIESASALIDRADRHLFRAKEQGRNRVFA